MEAEQNTPRPGSARAEAATPAPGKKPGKWPRRLRNAGIVLVALVALFGAFGYFAGPPLAKRALEDILAEKWRRPVRVAAIHINPYAMRVRVEGFSVGDGHGGEFIGFDALDVALDPASIIHAAPVVKDLRLTGPRVHVARLAPGRYDISDLLEEWLKPDDKPTPSFSVNNIAVTGGSVVFDDRPAGRKHAVTDMAVSLPFISNLAYQADVYTTPSFSAKIDGAPIKLTGRTKPFAPDRESELKFDATRIDLTNYLGYLPKSLPFVIAAGGLDTDLRLLFRQPKGKPAELGLAGRVALSGLRLTENGGAPLLNLKRFEVPLKEVAPLAGRIGLGAVSLDGLEIFARKGRDGKLNWLGLGGGKTGSQATAAAKTDDKAKPGAKAKPLTATLDALRLSDIALRWQDGPSATLDRFELTGVRVDAGKRTAHVDAAALQGLDTAVTRLADGSIQGLDALGDGAAAQNKPAAKTSSKTKGKLAKVRQAKPAPGAWTVEVAGTKIADVKLRFIDKALRHPAEQSLLVEKLDLGPVNSAALAETPVDLSLLLDGKGRLTAKGSVLPSPFSAKLRVDLRGFELLPLQPYFADKVNLTVTRGSLAAAGDVTLATGDAGLSGGFKGRLDLGGFHSVDKGSSADFLTWKSLHLDRVNVNLQPLSLAIGEVALTDFYARLIVSPQGKLNVLGIVKKNGAEKDGQAAEAGQTSGKAGTKPAAVAEKPTRGTPPKPSERAEQSPAVPVRIDRVTVQGGAVSFTDHFIKPNYSAKLSRIAGRVSGLSTDPASTADMDLRGEYEGAPLTILGTLNPLAASPALNIRADVRGVELTPMSPYFGKYAGYALEKGKLSLTVSYKIADRKLSAENHVFLDQLTFGDKVQSPSATKLPVLLAVALLKNRHGEIDINLPISGSLDDPDFSVGGIVVQVILNLLGKAVTSPFALIGSLFGGGEELSHVDFAAGSARLTPAAQKRLETLAKALDDRPALTLEVAGGVDPELDREGLRHEWLDRQVKARKLSRLVRGRREAGSVDDVAVTPEEYPDLLRQAYKRADFPKPRNFLGMAKGLPTEEMEKLMLTNAPAGPDELRDLANRRAQAVADWLRGTGKVRADRVFLLPPRRTAQASGSKGKKGEGLSRAEFSLK